MGFDKEYANLLKVISSNLKKQRLKRGLTQEMMTDYGYNYRYYQKLESGNYSLSLKTLYKLSLTFDVPISTFFKSSK